MKNLKFKIPKNKKEYNFVGLDANNATFVFPCQYFNSNKNIDKSEYELNDNKEICNFLKLEARKLIDIIARRKYEFYYGDGTVNFDYLAMKWLIQDFLTNGYYKEKKTESKLENKGKIDWKSTIRNKDIWCDGKNVVFKKTFRFKIKYEENAIITEIYKTCLTRAVENLGWMFGVGATEKSYFKIENKNHYNFMVRFLNKELRYTFLDYKKMVLKTLLQILVSYSGERGVNYLSASDQEFEYVFEFLVDSCFGSEYARDFYKNGKYNLYNRGIIKASKLRPDTIMVDNEVCYVIDAKYYDYGYYEKHSGAKDLPQTSSITKQIIYMRYIQAMAKDNDDFKKYKDVKSAFILRFSANSNTIIKNIGNAFIDSEVENVQVFLVDLKTLVDLYISNAKTEKDYLKQQLINNFKRCV